MHSHFLQPLSRSTSWPVWVAGDIFRAETCEVLQKFQLCSNPEGPAVALLSFGFQPTDGHSCHAALKKATVSILGPRLSETAWTFQAFDASQLRWVSLEQNTTESTETGWVDLQLTPSAMRSDEEHSANRDQFILRIIAGIQPRESTRCAVFQSPAMYFDCGDGPPVTIPQGSWGRLCFLSLLFMIQRPVGANFKANIFGPVCQLS